MNIHVNCFGACYRAEIERMIRLFYPTAALVIEDRAEMEDGPEFAESGAGVKPSIRAITLTIRVSIANQQVHAHVELLGSSNRSAIVHERTLALLDQNDTGAVRKAAKRAMLYALHEAFHAFSGFAQPWGILTGVRPAKLIHEELRKRGGTSMAGQVERLQTEYLIEPGRANLLVEVAERELTVVPDLYDLGREVSIYVGIPFCPTQCAYCTFPAYSMVEKAKYAGEFLRALVQELALVGALLREYGVPVTTVYVGGGTPTSLLAPELRVLLEAIHEHIPGSASWRELCVEAGRADTITPDRVAVMRDLKVNRVSVNPQSFKAATLKAIGRGHSPEIVDKRFMLFREAGFENVNMDLILGLPGEDLEDVLYSLERTLRLGPDSVTIHTMSFKRTAAVKRERDAFAIPVDDVVRKMMAVADREVRQAGLTPYYLYRQKDIIANLENVGYARPGSEGIYNICIIEEAQTIVGLGGGGASKWVQNGARRITRHQNPSEPRAYVESIQATLAAQEKGLREVFEAIVGGSGRRSFG